MTPNKTKQRLESGEVVFGCGIQQFRSVEIPRLFAAAGFDFTFIDTEHGDFDPETVHDLIRTARYANITAFVRVGELLYSLTSRALDSGAEGIIFPRVESAPLLDTAIGWTKFPPRGTRGFGISPASLDYQTRSFPQILDHLNANTMAVVQFETVAAIERCDELLAVPGIDVALVGPSDLSVSMGVPGEFEHPSLVKAIRGIIDACDCHHVFPGIQCRTLEMAKFWAGEGMRFVGCGSDLSLLLERARECRQELGSALREAASARGASETRDK